MGNGARRMARRAVEGGSWFSRNPGQTPGRGSRRPPPSGWGPPAPSEPPRGPEFQGQVLEFNRLLADPQVQVPGERPLARHGGQGPPLSQRQHQADTTPAPGRSGADAKRGGQT